MDKKKKHDIEIVIDRLVVKPGIERRLAESIETALRQAEGLVLVNLVDQKKDLLYSEKLACIVDGISYPEIAPNTFSFNSPQGACPTCDGLGGLLEFDPELIIPNPNLSLREGAIKPWAKRTSVYHFEMLESLAASCGFDVNTPFKDLKPAQQKMLLYGIGESEAKASPTRKGAACKPFEGIIEILKRRYDETDSFAIQWELEQYMNYQTCPDCNGSRLRKESLAIKVAGLNIHEITRMSIKQALAFFDGPHAHGKGDRHCPADPEGDPRAPRVHGPRGPRLPHARPRRGHALRRRRPAHPARHADRLVPRGRALYPGRTEHRPAPARQPQAPGHAVPAPRPRQHRARRGA